MKTIAQAITVIAFVLALSIDARATDLQTIADNCQQPTRTVCIVSAVNIEAQRQNGFPAGMVAWIITLGNVDNTAKDQEWAAEKHQSAVNALLAAWPMFHAEMQSRARVGFLDDLPTQQRWLIEMANR